MKLSGNAKDSAFLGKARFSNWKDATVGFANYEKSATHKRVMEVVVTLSQTHRDIGEILSTNHAFEKAVNRQCLMKIAENIRFLARQGLSFLLATDVVIVLPGVKIGRTGYFLAATALKCTFAHLTHIITIIHEIRCM